MIFKATKRDNPVMNHDGINIRFIKSLIKIEDFEAVTECARGIFF